jgi:hypothetical protein
VKTEDRKALLEKILNGNPTYDTVGHPEYPNCDECDQYREEWVVWNHSFQICVPCFIEIVKEVRSNE